MEIIGQYFKAAVEAYGVWGLVLMVFTVLLFGVQMYYYAGLFGKLPSYRIRGKKSAPSGRNGISVIVAMGDDYPYVESTLPLLLGQDHYLFEVIVVYVGANGEFAETLEALAASEPKLAVSRIKQHPLFPISHKMALNIGIKAARYDNIVVTTPDARPASERWLSLMAKGFEKSEIVIGYCGIEPSKGFADKVIRSSRVFASLLYLTAAIVRKPYRGIVQNMGFAKSLYFEHKGFDHLNLNLGEDDLFMQRLFARNNYTIVMHPRATIRQRRWGGLGWWMGEVRLKGHAYKFYPMRAKNFIEWEAGSRMLFFMAAIAAACTMPFEVSMAALGLMAVRFITVAVQMRRVTKRLGERGLVPLYFVNDLLGPPVKASIALWRMVRPVKEVWR